MYSPYLYARGSELLCLREIAGANLNTQGLLPILEPVNSNATNLIRCLNAWGRDVVVILNPYQKDFSNAQHINAFNQTLSGVIAGNNNIIMGLRVVSGINFQSLTAWISANSNQRIALIYDNAALSDAEIQILANERAVHYHVILNNSIPSHQCIFLPSLKIIVINDHFRKLSRNADYNGSEFYTNHHQYVGVNYLGFGDYTITGRVLDLGGGQPSAVASHLIYKELSNNSIWMKHFVSSNTQRGGADVATMFLDVADQITNFVPQHIPQFGSNIGLNNYYSSSQRRHSPGLGKNKQYQITHHISFMLDIINGRI